jgi:O-antigen/teichoic acid export membrane protein
MLIAGFFELLILHYFAWQNLPKKKKAELFANRLMKDIWKFGTTLTFTSIFATILKQLDKILISKLLPLEQMGYYVTATTVTNSLIKLVNPIIASVYPRMSSLVFEKNFQLLSELYHKSTQAILIIVAPLAGILFFYSYDILLFWTRSEMVASNAFVALSILSAAVLFNAALQPHYILQFASGLAWIPLVCNIISSIIMVPIIYFSIREFGINGAGFSWLLLNIMYFFIIPKITHTRILRHDYVRWVLNDSLYYIISSLFLFSIGFFLKSYLGINGISIILLIMASLIAYLTSIFYFKPIIFHDIENAVKPFFSKGHLKNNN